MQLLKQHIEALIFCSENILTLEEIQASLELSMGWEVEEEELRTAIEELKQKYASEEFSFELSEMAEGYQFLTKKEYHSTLSALIQHKAKKKLSVPQMETLAIIAYKQPISKTEIEHIRGVNCDYAVQKLLEKDLIEISGKSDGPGRPILYSTSTQFMEYFGIKNANDLPQLKDLRPEQNEIGVASDSMDSETIAEVSNVNTLDEQGRETEQAPMAGNSQIQETEKEITDDETSVAEKTEPLITDENPDASELPDRKSIFLENRDLQTGDLENPGELSSPDDRSDALS